MSGGDRPRRDADGSTPEAGADPTRGAGDRLACGVDVVAVDRIRRLLDRFDRSFVDRVYTPEEARYCRGRPAPEQHFAARWAAKEAATKALPAAPDGAIARRDVAVVRDADGRPGLSLSGRAAAARDRLSGPVETALSLSHDRTLGQATAQVVVLADRGDRMSVDARGTGAGVGSDGGDGRGADGPAGEAASGDDPAGESASGESASGESASDDDRGDRR